MHIIGREPEQKVIGFTRIEGHSIELGKVLAYVLPLKPVPFQILASRMGVQLMGSFPCVTRPGVEALRDMLDRALRQHEHLAAFPAGETQTYIPESVFDLEDVQRAAPLQEQ